MSLIRRKAIVNYKTSYELVNGEVGCYDSTKVLMCNMYGKVTEDVVCQWQYDLAKEEEKNIYDSSPIKSLSVTVTSFTKLDLNHE